MPTAMAAVDDEDGALIAEVLAGRTAAFEILVARHADVVYRVAARIVGPDEADDVSQDSFLRAFNRLDRFRGESSFRSWLLRITHNTALNAATRKVPEPVGEAEDVQSDGPAVASTRQPARDLEERERLERLELKLGERRSEHRAVLILRDLEGLPYEEIAQVTDSPVGSVKGRLHRARGELIEIMRRNTYDWELPE